MVKRGSALGVGYDDEMAAGDLDAFKEGNGGSAGASVCDGEDDFGSMDNLFINSCIRLCSAAAWPLTELFLVCSIW